MTFYFTDNKGNNRRKLKMSEVHQHLSECQIKDAIEDKKNDPDLEVSYMTVSGFITCEH